MRHEVRSRVLRRVEALFDKPLIQNNLRGIYAENMVAELLGEEWALTQDWAGYDLEHRDGARLEVKQSAARQTWHGPQRAAPRPIFSIRTPKIIWRGSRSEPTTGRPAEVYVFAWHGVEDDCADHRDPDQWQFFVLPEVVLPGQKTIGLARLQKLVAPVSASELQASVEEIRPRK